MMRRYKKANDGIHAPEEVKHSAAQQHSQARRVGWAGAVAAVLAVVIFAGVALHPAHNPLAPVAHANAIYEVQYPKTQPYPDESNLVTEKDWEEFDKTYDAWAGMVRARRDAFYAKYGQGDGLDQFYAATMRQFLSHSGGENVVYSPLNVYMALAMLAETTDGNSRQQILGLLGLDSIGEVRRLSTALWSANYQDDGATTSILASSLWLHQAVNFVDTTMKQLADTYFASSYQGEMGSDQFNKALQNWLNKQTGGLLKDAAGEVEMTPDTIMALATTLYFKVRWEDEFWSNLNTEEVFHSPKGDVTAQFMHQSGTGTYYWGDKFSAIERRFVQGGSMWLFLPDEGVSPADLLHDQETMNFITSNQKFRYENQKFLIINQSIPKFDVSSSFDLGKGLRELGITDVYDEKKADFSPLTRDMEGITLSQATHAARVMVDEEGCTAAAFTVMMNAGAAMPPNEEVDFILDRPFLFVITSDTDQILFSGVVNQP